MSRSPNTTEIIYNFVCNNPGLCTYEISKKINMTGGRVRHALSCLEKMGLIQFKFERNNPRIRKLTFPVSASELLPKSLMEELKKIRT